MAAVREQSNSSHFDKAPFVFQQREPFLNLLYFYLFNTSSPSPPLKIPFQGSWGRGGGGGFLRRGGGGIKRLPRREVQNQTTHPHPHVRMHSYGHKWRGESGVYNFALDAAL